MSMTDTHVTTGERQVVKMTVLSGPDAGMSRSFTHRERVGVGRGSRNEFMLSDGFVSNEHGELCFEGGQLIYRDLKSRHGSLVLVDDVSLHLQDHDSARKVRLADGAEIQVGCTLIRVELGAGEEELRTEKVEIDEVSGPTEEILHQQAAGVSGPRETMITTAMSGVRSLPRDIASSDDRLAILFRLAGELNSQTKLDEILDLIVDAVFQAFPAANFFAITLADDPEDVSQTSPFVSRVRGELPGSEDESEEPILSTSILRQVIETRESVLFVKDSLGNNVSQSILDAQITAALCAPLIGQRSLLGVMQVDTRGLGSLFSKQDLNLFSVFASNVAFALERAKLSENIVEMFESFVAASVNAIEARDPTTAGHSERVADYTLELAQAVNGIEVGSLKDIYLQRSELKELRYAALLHDFGKIAVRESVLRKGKRLPELHLDLIGQRFETIKALEYQRMIRGHFGNSREPMPPTKFHQLEARYQSFCDELDGTLNWLYEVAAAPFLEDEKIERVEKLGERFFLSPCGQRHPYLTAEEIENLTIKKGTLNEQEWEDMRSHAQRSQDYLERIPWGDELKQVPCIAGAHHEKLDGSGYPQGLDADEIIPQVRMLTIADIFDAVTAADRPYRKAATPERGVAILRAEAEAKKLDGELVEVFADRVLPAIIDKIPGHF
ncbi:GAF domain-containing protein [Persicimonas caeni]|uniref:GAF domain-containing protein n=1 Tax=Persicimonas caeni TaxID=2292766 RepID=A0A4Y6PPC5_PERCE|nr:HD domain-containing phosphohydrolase [Persicimonas caeni]QDG49959.1 GAF domain-containing protein [Persicimonas caeni]QED31180.1 GAF domain-containing protein [Persicimonas caeni]